MKVQNMVTDFGFGFASIKVEGSTVVTVGNYEVTFFAGELGFLNEIPKLSNKSKGKIIREFARLAAGVDV